MKKHIIRYILIIIFSFTIGFFVTNICNNFTGKLECQFQTNEVVQIDQIITDEKLEITINSSNKLDDLKDNKSFFSNGVVINKINDNLYSISTSKQYFSDSYSKNKQQMISDSKKFFTTLLEQSFSKENITYIYENIVIETNTFNEYLGGLISSLSLTLIYIVITIFNKKKEQKISSKNTLSIFSKEYWISSKSFLSNNKKIATLAMIFSLLLLSKLIKLPTGFSNLGLNFGFIFFSIIGFMYGPLAGLLIGFLSDVLGFFLFDTSGYPFFIGYVFQAMISGLIHGFFLYKKNPNFTRLFFLRITISLICNVIIGSICQGIVANYTYEQTISYMFIAVIPKNIIFLIPQTLFLFVLFKFLAPIIYKFTNNDQ